MKPTFFVSFSIAYSSVSTAGLWSEYILLRRIWSLPFALTWSWVYRHYYQ